MAVATNRVIHLYFHFTAHRPFSKVSKMTLLTLQRVESHLSSAERILLTEELCDFTLRQVREHIRTALQAAATERIRMEMHATRQGTLSVSTAPTYRHITL